MPITPINIDLNEKFEHLAHAPITEAVMEVRGPATAPWDRSILAQFQSKVPDYPKVEHQQEVTLNLQICAQKEKDAKPKPLEKMVTPQGHVGTILRLKTADGKRIAVFKKTAFSLSLLKPYSEWSAFSSEALRLWTIHQKIAKVEKVQRLGLRFINQITLPPENWELSEYLVVAPPDPKDLALPFMTFLHQDTFVVPNHPYQINCIRTIRPPEANQKTSNLIIDIDVGTTCSTVTEPIETKLAEMRWLKNKLFFGMLTEKALSLLR